jgi:site-specific recombinase XerD
MKRRADVRFYKPAHMTRHTFAATVTSINGVPIESVSKMLGHSIITTSMTYARFFNQKIGMDMLLVQNKLDKHKDGGAGERT